MNHDRVTIDVHVHPGSRHPGVAGTYADRLIVRVAARAVDGAANESVLVVLAQAFGLRRHEVDFVRVTRTRDKRVELRGDPVTLARRYDELRAGRSE